MATPRYSKYFFLSTFFHIAILCILLFGLDLSTPLPVLENTNKNDVISAVVLGDTFKSKILPQEPAALPTPHPEKLNHTKHFSSPKKIIIKQSIPTVDKKELIKQEQLQKEAIALKKAEEKKLADKKRAEKKKLREQQLLQAKKQRELQRKMFVNDLLADLQKQDKQHQTKKIKNKKLKSQFEKMLREESELSLRQQLLNEEIKLQGTQSRQAQGEINKYKALILQTISEHWIVPVQADKSLSCELMIRVAPGGLVLDVQITKSSGDPALDSSARAAVLKSSPLPVPNDAAQFEPFRQFALKVKPENVIANG